MIQNTGLISNGISQILPRPKSSMEDDMLQILVLERVEHEHNVHRYYVLALEPTLFGDTGLRREWGRLGHRSGASRLELHADADTAKEALEGWLARKRKRGYSAVSVNC